MDIPWIYLLIVVAWFLLFMALYFDDYVFLMLSGILLVALGIRIITDGISDQNNLTTEIFGIIHLGVAFYILVKKGFEYAAEQMGG